MEVTWAGTGGTTRGIADTDGNMLHDSSELDLEILFILAQHHFPLPASVLHQRQLLPCASASRRRTHRHKLHGIAVARRSWHRDEASTAEGFDLGFGSIASVNWKDARLRLRSREIFYFTAGLHPARKPVSELFSARKRQIFNFRIFVRPA